MAQNSERVEILAHKILTDASEPEQGQGIQLVTRRGDIACRFFAAPGTRRGALWVGGIGGGWDTPACGLYPRLCAELIDAGIASLRVRFRNPRRLADAVYDVRAGISYLSQQGIDLLALIGHSFGGAVVIQAAAVSPTVRTVVTLATQRYGTEPVACLGPYCSILLLHGTVDEVLPATCSQETYRLAREPKRLVLYPRAGHVLEEVANDVHRLIHTWILERLETATAP